MDRIFANVMAYFRQKAGLSQQTVSIKTGIAHRNFQNSKKGLTGLIRKRSRSFAKD